MNEYGDRLHQQSREKLSYVRHMIGELTHVARSEQADMLVYLLEMAFTEASELIGESGKGSSKIDGHQAGTMPVKPPR